MRRVRFSSEKACKMPKYFLFPYFKQMVEVGGELQRTTEQQNYDLWTLGCIEHNSFCCCCNKLTRIQQLKNSKFAISQFYGSEVQWAQLLFPLGISRGWNQGVGGAAFPSGALGKNPFPGSCVLLAEFSSIRLLDWGPCFLVSCQLGTTIGSLQPLSGSCPKAPARVLSEPARVCKSFVHCHFSLTSV